MKLGLSETFPSLKSGGLRQVGVGSRVVVAGRRLGADRRPRVAVRRVVVELQIERPARRRGQDLLDGPLGEDVLLVVAAADQRPVAGAAGIVLAARLVVLGSPNGPSIPAIHVQQVAVIEALGLVRRVGLPVVPAGRDLGVGGTCSPRSG